MSNNIEDDSCAIAIISFIIILIAFWRVSEDFSDSLICSLFVSLVGYGAYKRIKYVWRL